MKKIILAAAIMTTAMTGCNDNNNPLLAEFDTPHGTPPFSQIRLEHYMPAFKEGIAQSRADIEAIITNPREPSFENTIEVLERQGQLLNKVSTIFFALNHSLTSDEMDAIANEVMPMLTELSNDISLDPRLFERVKAVYEHYLSLSNLTTEQRMLLDNTYKGFTRNGAGLDEAGKEKYRELTTELSMLTLKFGQNVLASTNDYHLHIPATDGAKVEYMPDFVKSAMADTAAEMNEEGWVVTLHAPSYTAFMRYSRERDLKEKLWREYNTRSYGGQYDNSEMTNRIADLRLQVANLLGYETFADYVLEERMAESRWNVDSFLDELLAPTKAWAVDDYETVKEYAATLPDAPAGFMPWDFTYYDEKYKSEKYELNQELIKPYLKLENVEKGAFMLAERLFGVTFMANPAIEPYHPDVNVYEVYDGDGTFLAVLYMDYFPRASKQGGAWMTNFRGMYTTADGTEVRPLVTLNFNFTKPTGDTPALLTFDEFETVLHEFGHGLHSIFSEGTYESLTGTAVYRDFVELPSQLLENWATEKEFLDMFAEHYQTGDRMPEELIAKIVAAKNYMAAYQHVRQLSFGITDMAWHSAAATITADPGAFERTAMARTQILPDVAGTCFSTSFTHIFSGGYAAGYYSYKWAEVLEADAFSLFREKGIFNREVAESYRRNILAKGGSEHPMTLYVNFRGHKPETKALIEKIGEGR